MENQKGLAGKAAILPYLYLALPFLIWVLGWVRLELALPATVLVCLALWKIWQDPPAIWLPEWNRGTLVRMAFAAGIILLWLYFSGIGEFTFQNPDHAYRNAIFRLLAENPWPVISWNPTATLPEPAAFTYYIAFWLPGALVAKVLGIGAGNGVNFLWAFLGLFLTFMLISAWRRKLSLWPLLLLLFFSGGDLLGLLLKGGIWENIAMHLEWWGWPYQYSSFTTQLFWVFNQAIPVWVGTLLVLLQKNARHLLLIPSLVMLSSTLPFLGLLPFAAYMAWPALKEGRFREIFSLENLGAGMAVALLSYLYLRDNNAAQLFTTTNREFTDLWTFAASLSLFLLLEAGLFLLLNLWEQRKNPLFWLTGTLLILIPLFKLGSYGDFAMRVSIPALLVLFLLTQDTLGKAWKKKDKKVLVGLFLLLAVGIPTPLAEISRSLAGTWKAWRGHEAQALEPVDLMNTPGDNFWGDLEGNLFFTWLARDAEPPGSGG